MGVGTKGGLQTARTFIGNHGHEENLPVCCFKFDIKNACFNECHTEGFCCRLHQDFPELMSWVDWCYCSVGELRFGEQRITLTAGVQQGDPLGLVWSFWKYLMT